jgi:hypothetical protein
MNPSQLSLYWREWRACSEALKKLGHRGDDDQRHSLQRSALNERTVSSKNLTNAQLTAVLAKFRSFSQPGNLNAQLHAEDDAGEQAAKAHARIERLAVDCGIKGGLAGVSVYFKKWLGGKSVATLDRDTLRKLEGILRRRKEQGPGTTAAKPVAAKPVPAPCTAPAGAMQAVDDSDPF